MLWDERRRQEWAAASSTTGARGRAKDSLRQQRSACEAERSGSGGAVRWQRVQELRLAIAGGTYHVSVEEVADSLMRLAGGRVRPGSEVYLA